MFRSYDTKEELMREAAQRVRELNLTNVEIADLVDSSPPLISQMRKSRAFSCSTSKLIHILHKLGYQVNLSITKI